MAAKVKIRAELALGPNRAEDAIRFEVRNLWTGENMTLYLDIDQFEKVVKDLDWLRDNLDNGEELRPADRK